MFYLELIRSFLLSMNTHQKIFESCNVIFKMIIISITFPLELDESASMTKTTSSRVF